MGRLYFSVAFVFFPLIFIVEEVPHGPGNGGLEGKRMLKRFIISILCIPSFIHPVSLLSW